MAKAPHDPTPPPGAVIRHHSGNVRGNGHAVDYGFVFDGEEDAQPEAGWLIKNILPAQGVGILAGQTGTGKTYLTFEAAAAIAATLAFASEQVDAPGGVLMFAAEGSTLASRRWKAARKAKVEPFLVHEGQQPTLRVPVAWTSQVPDLGSGDALVEMIARCEAFEAQLKSRHFGCSLSLVIIDTLAAAANFDDPNDAGEAQVVMNVLAKLALHLECCVLAVDHFGKNVERGVRGSSAKEAAADFVLGVLGERDDETGVASRLELIVRKMRGGPSGARMAFELQPIEVGTGEDLEPQSDLTVRWLDARPVPRQNKRFALLSRALDEALQSHGQMSQPAPGMPTVLTVEARFVRDSFSAIYPPTENETARRETVLKAFRRAVRDMTQNHLIASYAYENERVLMWRLKSGQNGQDRDKS